MPRQTTAKDLDRLFKKLSEDDQERVLEFARKMAGPGSGTEGRESLTSGNAPSYLAMADERQYSQKKEEIDKNRCPDPREQ